jgi:exodeoxyribonuclease VIII
MKTKTTLGPGIHTGVPFSEYLAHPALSRSELLLLDRSPAHFQAREDVKKEETPALVLGSAIHTMLLEPHLFWGEYAEAPKVDRRTKAGKEAHAAFLEANAGKRVLTPDQLATCTGIAKAVASRPAVEPLLACKGQNEVTAIWTDETTGLELKARADRLIETRKGPLLLDLKTTQDASPLGFAKSIGRFKYHLQAALYLSGFAACGVEDARFGFLAFEKEPPYAAGVYVLGDESLEEGARTFRRLLETLRKCTEAGEWPDYAGTPQMIEMPKWAFTEEEDAA